VCHVICVSGHQNMAHCQVVVGGNDFRKAQFWVPCQECFLLS
jgi:hypothetical protein